jgi:tetratricopeptide (TPR) repeat protein
MSDSRSDAAFTHFRAGRLREAEVAYAAIVEREPRNAEALHLLGFIRATTGRRDEGLALLDRALALEPANPSMLDNRAQILMQAGRDEAAHADLARAVEIAPRMAAAWLHLGQVLRRLARGDEALGAIARALTLEPASTAARYQEGLLHLEAGRHGEAEASLRQVLAREPRHLQALTNLGVALHRAGKGAEAIGFFERALQVKPGHAPALLNWGNTLRDAGDLAGARARFGEALAADPKFVPALVNAASERLESEDLDAARALYEQAAAASPGQPDALAGLAQVQLREQRFAEAWENYERRFATDPPAARNRSLPMPRLTRENLPAARRVAVWKEQGVGDQILFSTLLPDLVSRGLEAVVEVDARLVGLYRRGLAGITFVTPEESEAAFAGCDAHVPLGSLPRLLRPDAAAFAAQPRAILAADPRRVASYREELGSAPAIAISWRSLQKGSRQGLGERKSIPLEAFARLAGETGARHVDVQYGDVAEERSTFEARHPGVLVRLEGLDPFSDLEGLAAALVACGRVVSSSNVTAHLAGALGVPTDLVYLRGWAPFSYWVPGPGGRSLWYPSVSIPGTACREWGEAFTAVASRQ